jgi:hypothetical protein
MTDWINRSVYVATHEPGGWGRCLTSYDSDKALPPPKTAQGLRVGALGSKLRSLRVAG